MNGRISPSLVISVIALFVALGGASYAAIKLPKNSVGSAQIRSGAVKTNKVKDGTLLKKDFRAGQMKPDAWEGYRLATPAPIASTFTPVVTTDILPKGNYLLLARANILGDGSIQSRIICSVGNDAAQNVTVGQSAVLALSLNGTVALSEPGEVSLSCLKTAGNPEVGQAHVIAVPIGRLQRLDNGS